MRIVRFVAALAGVLLASARVLVASGGVLLASGGVLVVLGGPAFAHGGEAPDATAYRIEVTGLNPGLPGVSVRLVEGGARLELHNETGHSVEVLGYQGEPYLDVRADGTWQNVNSPAAYVNETLDGTSAVPSNADPTAAPSWQKISTDTTVRWHDQRIRTTRSPWSVPLRTGVDTYAIEGTVTWEDPPITWLWWAGAVALAAAVITVGHRHIGPVALTTGIITFGYAVTRAAVSAEGQAPAIAAALLAVAAGVWGRRAPILLLVGGLAVTVFAGANEAGILHQAVVNFPAPGWTARLAVIIALGAGTGIAGVGIRRLRAAPISSNA